MPLRRQPDTSDGASVRARPNGQSIGYASFCPNMRVIVYCLPTPHPLATLLQPNRRDALPAQWVLNRLKKKPAFSVAVPLAGLRGILLSRKPVC